MSDGTTEGKNLVEHVSYVEEPPDKWGTAATVLTAALLLVVVTALSGFLYLLLTGVVNPPAPRTALEARLEVIEAAITTSPKNGKVWADYILVTTSMERFVDAKKVWDDSKKQLAKLPDEMIQADLAWAQSLMLQARPKDALKQAELVIRNDPEAVRALGKKNPSMYEMGLTRTGMLAPAYVVKGNSLVALERWAGAAEAYTAAIKEDPGAADLLFLRGGSYLEAGEKDKARADVEKGLMFLPDNPRGLAILKELGDD